MTTSTNLKTWICTFCCLLCMCVYAQRPEHAPNEFIIKMKPYKSMINKLFLKNQMQAVTLKTIRGTSVEVWQIPDTDVSVDVRQIINQYKNHPDIEYIEPNYYYYITDEANEGQDLTPSDFRFGEQWGLHNTGQDNGTPDVDIDAPEAWDIATGSPSVEVAVIDTGVDWRHPDLINNIWQNLGEDADGDGHVLEQNIHGIWVFDPDDLDTLDNDGNGYIDDLIGWDFIDNDNTPQSNNAHGTHVAGIIGADGNNDEGISGVTWDVQLVPLRAIGTYGRGSNILEAIYYAIDNDIPISNNSYENIVYSNYSQAFIDALQAAEDNNHLFVVAAGNSNNDIDAVPNYPASFNSPSTLYDFDNIISVAATDRDDELWYASPSLGSNYGASSVSIGAPGADILSTIPRGNYGYKNGTSMATPHVVGACALLMEKYPNASYQQIKEAILNTADSTPALADKCTSNGRLNLYGAMNYLADLPPVGCRERDSLALVALYNAADGQNWTWRWNLNQPMDYWYGVGLNEDGCVTNIGMEGNFSPFEYSNYGNYLIGNLPPEIGNLTSLQGLNLGTTWAGSKNSNFVNIPAEIENLTNLKYLTLGLDNAANLPPEIGNLPNLTHLHLILDSLTSLPPEIVNLPNLSSLNIENGQFDNIPSWVFNLTDLTSLSMRNNQFTGSIPIELGNLNSLKYLYLSNNQFTGNIPLELGSLSTLDLSRNQLNGSIPSELGNLSLLYLNDNQLTGNIPLELANLNRLYLNNNQLTGSIPPEFGNTNSLKHLYLNDNQLSGCYDGNLMNLCSQSLIDFNHNINISNGNNFNASWFDFCYNGIGACNNPYPDCRERDSLALVALYNATDGSNWSYAWDLSQPVKTWNGVLTNGFGCVERLSISTSQVSGNIPSELGNLENLKKLLLANNQLSGSIPPEIGNLENLRDLQFYNTQLSGSIPPELGNLTNLRELHLFNNQLTGSIPAEIGNLNNLTELSLYDNDLSGCYHINLMNLCGQLWYNNGAIINGNNFNTPWEDFCATSAGTCDLVWPGDYNYDGKVTELDHLYCGLAYGFTGSVRPSASTAFEGQDCPDWSFAVEGINSKHQDGNGDGIVDESDFGIVEDNFKSIHNYVEPVYIASGMQYELRETDTYLGSPSYDIHVVGNELAHGLSGMLEFYDTPIDSVIMRTTSSALAPTNTFMQFDTIENNLHFAITRNDRINIICDTMVVNFIFVMQDIPSGDTLKLSIENGTNVQANGDIYGIAGMTYEGYAPTTIASADLQINTSVVPVQCNVAGSAWVVPRGGTGEYSYRWSNGATDSILYHLNAGIYEVTVTDSADSTQIASVEVGGLLISPYDQAGNPIDCEAAFPRLTPDLHVLLEGAYDATGDTMRIGLQAVDTLPSGRHPYTQAPWNYAGLEGLNWTSDNYPEHSVDWVLVSFRTDLTRNTQIARAAAILQTDGSLYFPNGNIRFADTADAVYIIIEHRNHVAVMTPQPVSIVGNTLMYDFRLSDSYRDPTSFGQKQLANGKWVMYAGDCAQIEDTGYDINGNDKVLWDVLNGSFSDYFLPDFNLDGDVNGADKILWKSNNGISSRVPK